MVPRPPNFPYCTGWHFVANVFIRSAAFHALLPGAAGKRFIVSEPRVIPSLSNYVLTQHAGEQLAQTDLDALFGVTAMFGHAELCGEVAPDEFLTLRIRPLLFASRRKDTKNNRETLMENLVRLAAASFTVSLRDFPDASFDKTPWHLIELVKTDKSEVSIKVSSAYRALIQLEHTGICSHEREQLTPDGRWLHAFFSSHKSPFPFTPLELARLIGRTKNQGFGFEPALARQLEILTKVTGWECALEKGMTLVKKKGKGRGFSLKKAPSMFPNIGDITQKATKPFSIFENDEI